MAITQTTLSADLGTNDVTMAVTSGTGFPSVGTIATPGYLVRIDKEYMLAKAQPVANTITIARRGFNGTAAAAHDILAKVEVSSAASDFNPNPPGSTVDLTAAMPVYDTIGENITYTTAQIAAWGNQPRDIAITKATAAAIVLVAPSKAQDGLVLRFTSLTAAIHVITATALLANGDASSPYTTATMANAKIGATLTLMAQNGLWNVVSAGFWTLT
jgi:hypothetical protein